MTSPLRTLLMLLGAVVTAVAHATGPSFDCTKAKAWSEIRVCSDTTLSTLDRQVVTLFGDAKTRLTGQAQQQLIAEQKAWLRARESCKRQSDQATCLLGVYEKRILQLRSGVQSKQVLVPAAPPQGNSGGHVSRVPSRSFNYEAIKKRFENYGEGLYGLWTKNYATSYLDSAPESLVIVLFKEPWAESRMEAENKLLEITGNSKEELCAAKVTVNLPWWSGLSYTKDFGLSFCPGSLPLK